jgi:acyl-CoA thioester hydrolase
MTPFVYTRRVEFGETDMAGIMHFSNYFRYMEAAETAFLRDRGLSVHWSEAGAQYGFPRVSVSCDYARPVRFEDEVEIAVIVEKLGTKSIGYRFEFRRDGAEIAVGRITAVFCRSIHPAPMESIAIPESIRIKLAPASAES